MQKFSVIVANILRSQKLFIVILIVFVVQGVFFAFTVNPSLQDGPTYLDRTVGVVPDGNRHMAVIYHHASQPLAESLLIKNMQGQEMTMGDLERFPSYLYQFLMSFLARIALVFGVSDWWVVMMIRLIGVGFGVLALIVFRKIILEIKAGHIIANLAMLGLAMTGSFAYMSPAENYDVPAFLLWLVFLLASLRLFIRKDPVQLYWMLLAFLVLSITKYTYIPFAGATGVVAVFLYVYNVGYAKVWQYTTKELSAATKRLPHWKLWLLGGLTLLFSVLFIERIGVNLVQYHDIKPRCDRIHSVEECMQGSVYARNHDRIVAVEAGETWTEEYEFFDYTERWFERYYHSTYYYMGHIWVYEVSKLFDYALRLVVLLMIVCVSMLVYRRQSPLKGQAEWFLAGVASLFVLAQYVFNALTFIQYSGQMYGHQGRYLLPAVAIAYVLLLLVVRRAYGVLAPRYRPYFLVILLIIGVVVLVCNAALPNFFIHADSYDWFSDVGRFLVPESWL